MAAPAERVREQTKHQQRTEATRRALLDAARRIFARDGFEASRIEDIASATGHTRGAFYAHFSSKEDLFFALLEQDAGERLRGLRSVLERCPDSENRMRALRKFYVARASDRQWVMLALEFKLFALRHPKLRARLARTHRRIRESLKPNGRLVLLEYRGEDPKVPIRPEHKMTLKQVQQEVQPEGYRFEQSIEILPQQHIIVFRK